MPAVNDLTKAGARRSALDERVALADGLWRTNIHEARIAAAKLLTQARIRDDDAVWRADRLLAARFRRLGDRRSRLHGRASAGWWPTPPRLDEVEGWTRSDHLWTKRAALVITLPWTKQNHPKPEELAARDRVLGWAAAYVDDQEWFIQKAVAWWLRELSKHDPDRVRAFLAEHGERMKPFARKEAGKYLTAMALRPRRDGAGVILAGICPPHAAGSPGRRGLPLTREHVQLVQPGQPDLQQPQRGQRDPAAGARVALDRPQFHLHALAGRTATTRPCAR